MVGGEAFRWPDFSLQCGDRNHHKTLILWKYQKHRAPCVGLTDESRINCRDIDGQVLFTKYASYVYAPQNRDSHSKFFSRLSCKID